MKTKVADLPATLRKRGTNADGFPVDGDLHKAARDVESSLSDLREQILGIGRLSVVDTSGVINIRREALWLEDVLALLSPTPPQAPKETT